jgi:hypothetical protein
MTSKRTAIIYQTQPFVQYDHCDTINLLIDKKRLGISYYTYILDTT